MAEDEAAMVEGDTVVDDTEATVDVEDTAMVEGDMATAEDDMAEEVTEATNRLDIRI